jgi:predicted CopG family antitoxin
MQKKLTVTIDEEVYEGLREVIGPRKISRFIEDLVRPHVTKKDIYAAYKEMAADEVRESEALEWAEATFGDINHANQFLNRVQVIPLTSNIDKPYPSETYIMLRGKKAKAMADQLTTVSKKRLINREGTISNAELEGIKRAISIQLAL